MDFAVADEGASLEQELMWLQAETFRVQVASRVESTLREAPGVVSVITGEEIANSGARDMIDVLNLVPGFSFGADTFNMVSLGVRGIRGYEGKVALFVDGVEFNERRFGTTLFGNHFPVDQIKRIEIIRGPGSVMYGGFAELGVINIITKDGQDIDGVSGTATYGGMSRGDARKNISVMAGKKMDDWNVSALGFVGEGRRSDRYFKDYLGNRFDMAESNELKPAMANIGVQYKNLKMRFIADDYEVDSRDNLGNVFVDGVRTAKFSLYAYDASYSHEISDNAKVQTKFAYSHQSPWEGTYRYFNGATSSGGKLVIDHYDVNLNATIGSTDSNYIVFGGEFALDEFNIVSLEGLDTKEAQERAPSSFENYTAFTEGMYRFPWANVTAGLRFDYFSQFGTNLAPRIGLTKAFDRFHYKILYSHAFRTPTIENLIRSQNYNLNPETTRIAEVELGYQLSKKMSLSTNLFWINNDNSILYSVDKHQHAANYVNSGVIDTYGVEVESAYRDDWGYVDVNYSFYRVAKNNAPDDFRVINFQTGSEMKDISTGFPDHKISLNAHVNIFNDFSVNPSFIYLTDRYGYGQDQDGSPVLKNYGSSFLANVFFRYKNVLFKNVDVGFGVYDIFNEKFTFVQHYNGGHPGLPGPSREFVLKLSCKF